VTKSTNRKNKYKLEPFSDSQLEVNTVAVALSEGSSIAEINKKINELLRKNEEGFYCCTLCGKVSDRTQSHMKNHIETHLEGISFPCNFCGKQFRSRNILSVHKNKNHRQERDAMVHSKVINNLDIKN